MRRSAGNDLHQIHAQRVDRIAGSVALRPGEIRLTKSWPGRAARGRARVAELGPGRSGPLRGTARTSSLTPHDLATILSTSQTGLRCGAIPRDHQPGATGRSPREVPPHAPTWSRPAVTQPSATSPNPDDVADGCVTAGRRSAEHTSELQSLRHLVCRLLLAQKNPWRRRARTSPAHTRSAPG